MRLRSKSLVAARPQVPPSWLWVRTSRLSISAPIQGSIFSSSVPGRKPMSSPRGIVTRVMMISAKRLFSSVCISPAASVSNVLPVPAGPRMDTKSMFGSINRFNAKFCSRLRAAMPQTLCRSLRKSRTNSSCAVWPSIFRTSASMPSWRSS